MGRQAELLGLEELLDRHRWVTILGPPGVGKTRLAREYLGRAGAPRAGRAAPPAWFCDLAEATSEGGIALAVAQVLGVRLAESRRHAVERLGGALAAHGPTLLVLDNFEQIAAHAATTVGAWLVLAPEARFLLTSRERCGGAGEALLDLGPLPLAAPGRPVADSPAVQLFVARACAARHDFSLKGREAAVAGLVADLDGLPLAIELAAARMRVLAPEQLFADPRRRLGLLATHPALRAGAQAAHRRLGVRAATLTKAIDLSWRLLAPWERSVLAQLAVFRGGFDLASTEAVVDLARHPGAPPVLEVLSALRDKSLLFGEEPPARREALRYRLLVSIRAYAFEQLERSGEAPGALDRHARHFLHMGRTWSRSVDGRGGIEARAQLALERENLAAVYRRKLANTPPDAGQALEAALALAALYLAEGPFDEYAALLSRALAAGPVPDEGLRGQALFARGEARRLSGEMAASREDYAQALEIARRAGDHRLEAEVLIGEAIHRFVTGSLDGAIAAYRRAIAASGSARDPVLEGRARCDLGRLELHRGRRDAGRALLEEARRLFDEAGSPRFQGRMDFYLGEVAEEQGRLPEARARYLRALRVLRALGERGLEAATMANLATLAQQEGRLAASVAAYRRALDVCRRTGYRWLESAILSYLGTCLHELGRLDEAAACYEDALRLCHRLEGGMKVAVLRGRLGALRAALGDVDGAASAFATADAHMSASADRVCRAAVTLYRGHLDLALARRADADGDRVAARRHLTAARARLAAAGPAGSDRSSLDDRSTDVRLALASLRRALAEHSTGRAGEWTVGPQGSWFRDPHGKRADLARHGALCRVLAALTLRRLAAPGTVVSVDRLFQCGWPGERALPQAAVQRVYTALWAMRKLGLRDLIRRRDDGYLLDPEARLVQAAARLPPAGGRARGGPRARP